MLPDDLFTIQSTAGFALLVAGVAVVAAMPRFRVARYRGVVAAAGALLAFQAFHFLEHLIQLGYWFMHPDARPYMTPWATVGADGLGLWSADLPGAGTPMMRGMELLHLVGNLLFLGGLIALGQVAKRARPQMRLPGLGIATVAQSVHVAEHVLLSATLFGFGEAYGISTLFGYGNGAAWGGTVRVWFHFLINLAGTAPAAVAFATYLDEGAYRAALRRFEPAHADGFIGAFVRR